jgi:hypothetical protein
MEANKGFLMHFQIYFAHHIELSKIKYPMVDCELIIACDILLLVFTTC